MTQQRTDLLTFTKDVEPPFQVWLVLVYEEDKEVYKGMRQDNGYWCAVDGRHEVDFGTPVSWCLYEDFLKALKS